MNSFSCQMWDPCDKTGGPNISIMAEHIDVSLALSESGRNLLQSPDMIMLCHLALLYQIHL